MSSSRVQTNLTGAPTALDASTAAGTKSTSRRRPNPPPSSVVWTLTWSGFKPAASAAAACAICCDWVPTYTSHRSALRSAVQFMGSMHACARSGSSYTAEKVLAAFLRASAALPLLREAETSSLPSAEAPGLVAALSSSARIAADPHSIACLPGLPEVVSHDNHAARGGQNPTHAWHCECHARIERCDLP